MLTGIIIKGIGGFYYIKTSDGIIECKARGKFRNEKIKPVVGDRVKISVLKNHNNKGSIEEILSRKNELIRPSVSNIDQAIVVFAAKSPDPNLGLLDRFLILAESKGLDIVVCFNKIDLRDEKAYQALRAIYTKAGYPVLSISTYEDIGIQELKEFLKNKTSVFAGPSGVGKSSILNKVQPDLCLKTGEISEKLERGKHTTRHVELLDLEIGGYVLDTPGFSSLDLKMMGEISLEECYPEFLLYKEDCRFNGCCHIHEPECAVKRAVEEKHIDKGRYERYIDLYNEMKDIRRW